MTDPAACNNRGFVGSNLNYLRPEDGKQIVSNSPNQMVSRSIKNTFNDLGEILS